MFNPCCCRWREVKSVPNVYCVLCEDGENVHIVPQHDQAENEDDVNKTSSWLLNGKTGPFFVCLYSRCTSLKKGNSSAKTRPTNERCRLAQQKKIKTQRPGQYRYWIRCFSAFNTVPYCDCVDSGSGERMIILYSSLRAKLQLQALSQSIFTSLHHFLSQELKTISSKG